MVGKNKLNAMSDRELASFLCDVMEKIADKTDKDVCDICPVNELCSKGCNGFYMWLTSEQKEVCDR